MSDTTNIDDLLDASIDDLADLPEFSVFHPGVHKVIVTFEKKKINEHPSIEMKMKLVETLELANPVEDQPQAAGTESSMLFTLDNEFGQGKLKEVMKPLAAMTGVSKISEVMAAMAGAEITVVTKKRMNKDKSATYLEITKVIC